jgi:hypothetical protein
MKKIVTRQTPGYLRFMLLRALLYSISLPVAPVEPASYGRVHPLSRTLGGVRD